MIADGYNIWLIILAMGVGTFGLRYSFLGLVGGRKIPDWVLRHLRYTAVAVMPGLIAPLILWPQATSGQTDAARLVAAAVAVAVGVWTKSVILTVGLGMAALYAMQALV